MTRVWDGEEGEDWTRDEEHYNEAVARFDAPLFAAAAIEPSDAVLDIGCGTGFTTREAARRAHTGRALGVDLSARMLERARERAQLEGLENAVFEQADAQVHRFAPHSFDIAISRFGAMFFDDQVAAFANIAAAIGPRGRLVLLVWQGLPRNAWVSTVRDAFASGRSLPEPEPGRPGPFGLADAERARRILGGAGFDKSEVMGCAAPMWLGADIGGALAFVGRMGIVRGLTADLDEGAAARGFERLRSSLEQHATADGVLFDAAAWLITARRR
ncbi:MAG: class I SAM-dependent methyltransferase [Candidatus Dormibacteria bacterium]